MQERAGEVRWMRALPGTDRVLVTDPYASGRRTICTCVAELGYEALEAQTAGDARLIAASNVIDLIITSYDDLESVSLLVELHDIDCGVPALLLTTWAQTRMPVPAYAKLLLKPLTLDVLARAIELMSRHKLVARV
jgi:DNA-binding NtrC family response regulator